MADKFSKSHPWRVTVLKPIKTTMMGHAIEQPAGERMTRTKTEALQFRAAVVAENGEDSCGPVVRA